MRTVEEAGFLWCPLARVANLRIDNEQKILPVAAYNRLVATKEDGACAELSCDHLHVKCISSSCMAWRWTNACDFEGNQMLGYCGLAGRP